MDLTSLERAEPRYPRVVPLSTEEAIAATMLEAWSWRPLTRELAVIDLRREGIQ